MWTVTFRYHGFENIMMRHFSTMEEAWSFANTCNYQVVRVGPKP